jgi:hypothetical protein
VGGTFLASITNLGGIFPAVTWGGFGLLAFYRSLKPGFKFGRLNDDTKTKTDNKTRKAVAMIKTTSRELVKSAAITILFHTVGVDALSL